MPNLWAVVTPKGRIINNTVAPTKRQAHEMYAIDSIVLWGELPTLPKGYTIERVKVERIGR